MARQALCYAVLGNIFLFSGAGRSLLRGRRVIGASKQIISAGFVVIRQHQQVLDRDRPKAPLIPGIDRLRDHQDFAHLLLGQVMVGPQVLKPLEIH